MKRCRVNQSLWLVLLFFLFVSFAVPKNCTDDLNLYLPPTDTGTAGSISQFPRVPMIDRDKASISRAQALTNGYYFLQQVGAYYVSAFGLISTAHEADSIATILNKHLVSGIEYGPGYFHQEDISACITVAKEFQLHGIDLWLTSTGPLDNFIRAFNEDGTLSWI